MGSQKDNESRSIPNMVGGWGSLVSPAIKNAIGSAVGSTVVTPSYDTETLNMPDDLTGYLVTPPIVEKFCSKPGDDGMHAIGKALTVIQGATPLIDTPEVGAGGFFSHDAKDGTISFRSYRKHNKLEDWVIKKWLKPTFRWGDGKDYSRIAAYWRILDMDAHRKNYEKQTQSLVGSSTTTLPLTSTIPYSTNAIISVGGAGGGGGGYSNVSSVYYPTGTWVNTPYSMMTCTGNIHTNVLHRSADANHLKGTYEYDGNGNIILYT